MSLFTEIMDTKNIVLIYNRINENIRDYKDKYLRKRTKVSYIAFSNV